MVVKVDMEPFASGAAGVLNRYRHQLFADPSATHPLCDQGVEDEGVTGSIPGDIDETDQGLAVAGAYPTETVILDLGSPVVDRGLVTEPFGMKRFDVGTVEFPPPVIFDGHWVRLRWRLTALPSP